MDNKKVAMIDNVYSDYLLHKNEAAFKKDLGVILKALSKKDIAVVIVNTSMPKEPFFGMRIYPSASEMDSILQAISDEEIVPFKKVLDQWRDIKSWVLEIDTRVLDRSVISFNPSELTAMTLHEIGHTIYSEKKIEQWYRAYLECRVKLSVADKAIAKVLYFMYSIPLAMACGIRDWRLTTDDLKEEVFADATVSKLGYGEHLISAFNKIIKACGNGNGSYSVSDAHTESQMIENINWANINIKDMIRRKNKLKDELYYKGTRTNSNYIQDLIHNVMNKLSVVTKNRYSSNIATEAAIVFEDGYLEENTLQYDLRGFSNLSSRINGIREAVERQIATEAAKLKINHRTVKVPSQLDVDTISVEVDRIENHADRRYVLDLIYSQEEAIENFKEYFKYDESLKNKYGIKMDSMLHQLYEMRKVVLSKKTFNKDYKVFVKYPVGYEG